MWDEVFQNEEKAIQKAATKIRSGKWTEEDAMEAFVRLAPSSLPNKYQKSDPNMHMVVALRLMKRLKEVL
jgi:hypothetical protein